MHVITNYVFWLTVNGLHASKAQLMAYLCQKHIINNYFN